MAKTRRDLLTAASAVGIATIAGCSGNPLSSDTQANNSNGSQNQTSGLSSQQIPSGYTVDGIESVFEAVQHIESQIVTTDANFDIRRVVMDEDQVVSEELIQYRYTQSESKATLTRERDQDTIDGKNVNSSMELRANGRNVTANNETTPYQSHTEAVAVVSETVTEYITRLLESIRFEPEGHSSSNRVQYTPVNLVEEPTVLSSPGPISGTYTIRSDGYLVSANISMGDKSEVNVLHEITTALSN